MSGFAFVSRERIERWEEERLAPAATRSASSKGRARAEAEDPLRTCFQRDRDRIVHSKAFRRLKHKTQVFIAPFGDHYRTRLTHTLEVAQISRTVARALGLNEDLAEAIALGHDLGHTPFGHLGERVLSDFLGRPFVHSEQSLRVVDVLEKDGMGLNLTEEVRDGIRCHSWSQPEPSTPEGWVVRYSDRIAYLCHDVDDALRAGIIDIEDIPEAVNRRLGRGYSERIGTLVSDLVEATVESGRVQLSDGLASAIEVLRDFMFERVYFSREVTRVQSRAEKLLSTLLEYYLKHPDEIRGQYRRQSDPLEVQVADYISGMTDRYAVEQFRELFVPQGIV